MTNNEAVDRAGLEPSEVVKVHETPGGTAIVTAANHAVTDPGDALPVSVQRGTPVWQSASDRPDPVGNGGR